MRMKKDAWPLSGREERRERDTADDDDAVGVEDWKTKFLLA
jgi:hypothetical protein